MKMDKLIEGHNWVYLTHVVLSSTVINLNTVSIYL